MKRVAQLISWSALAASLAPPCMYYAGGMELATMQHWMLVAAVAWFAATPLWMEHNVDG
jgi:hypothetical protein